MSFAKLAQQTTDLIDVQDVYNEASAITGATVTKRKRAPDTVIADECETSGPPSRLRTGTRSKSRASNNTEVGVISSVGFVRRMMFHCRIPFIYRR